MIKIMERAKYKNFPGVRLIQTGYTTGMALLNHSVGLTNYDLKALIASAVSYEDRVF
jgi:hypothetical protein